MHDVHTHAAGVISRIIFVALFSFGCALRSYYPKMHWNLQARITIVSDFFLSLPSPKACLSGDS